MGWRIQHTWINPELSALHVITQVQPYLCKMVTGIWISLNIPRMFYCSWWMSLYLTKVRAPQDLSCESIVVEWKIGKIYLLGKCSSKTKHRKQSPRARAKGSSMAHILLAHARAARAPLCVYVLCLFSLSPFVITIIWNRVVPSNSHGLKWY